METSEKNDEAGMSYGQSGVVSKLVSDSRHGQHEQSSIGVFLRTLLSIAV